MFAQYLNASEWQSGIHAAKHSVFVGHDFGGKQQLPAVKTLSAVFLLVNRETDIAVSADSVVGGCRPPTHGSCEELLTAADS